MLPDMTRPTRTAAVPSAAERLGLRPLPDSELVVDIDDAEGGPGAPRVRRRRAPTLREDGLAMVAAGAVRLESARRGISQQDLAQELGMSRTAVSARFTGQVPWSLDQIGQIARLFGCRVVDLLVEAPNLRGIVPW